MKEPIPRKKQDQMGGFGGLMGGPAGPPPDDMGGEIPLGGPSPRE